MQRPIARSWLVLHQSLPKARAQGGWQFGWASKDKGRLKIFLVANTSTGGMVCVCVPLLNLFLRLADEKIDSAAVLPLLARDLAG